MAQSEQLAELRHRIKAKQKHLQARIEEAKADSSAEAGRRRKDLETRLEKLEDQLRDGWDNLTDATLGKINAWLKDDDAKDS